MLHSEWSRSIISTSARDLVELGLDASFSYGLALAISFMSTNWLDDHAIGQLNSWNIIVLHALENKYKIYTCLECKQVVSHSLGSSQGCFTVWPQNHSAIVTLVLKWCKSIKVLGLTMNREMDEKYPYGVTIASICWIIGGQFGLSFVKSSSLSIYS